MNHIADYLAEAGVNPANTRLRELAAILEKMPADWRARPDVANGDCPYGLCGGAGMTRYDVPVSHPLFGKGKTCQCATDKMHQSNEQRIAEYEKQLTATERTYTLKNWIGTDEKAREAAARAVQTLRGIKVFIGPYGTGKTGLLAAIVNSVLEKRVAASYWVVNDLLNKLRGAYDPKDLSSFDRALEQLCGVRVLALDEMSAYKPSEWADNTLRTLIDERYRRWDSLLTVIGGNELPNHEAIVSRFQDSVRSELVYVKGADLRPLAKDLMEPDQFDFWLMDDADVLAVEADAGFAGVTNAISA